MTASEEDRRALRQALRKVRDLAEAAEIVTDTDAVCRCMWAVRGAAIDAYALAKAVEDHTRNAALREVEERLCQQVGMEPEHL